MTTALTTCTNANANPADTNGWDTVYAVTFPTVNAAIASQGSSPTAFSFSETDPTFGAISTSGKFGTWQLASGGSGQLVWMSVPVSSGTLQIAGNTVELSNITITIEVQMEYVEGTSSAKPQISGGQTMNLVVSKTGAASSQPVIIQTISGFSGSAVAQAIWQGLMSGWFNANIGDFDHVFAAVDMGAKAATGAFQWLMPTQLGYAVVDNGDTSIFGVLAMVTSNPRGADQVSPYAIPTNASLNSCLLINYARFLENMVLPSLTSIFPGSSASSFTITGDGTQITNSAALTLDLQDNSGDSMTATIPANGFTFQVNATTIALSFVDINYPYQGTSTTVHLNYNGQANLGIDANSHLMFQYIGTPSAVVSCSTPESGVWGWIGLSVLISIATLGFGAMMDSLAGAAAETANETIDNTAQNAFRDGEQSVASEVNVAGKGINPGEASNAEEIGEQDAGKASTEVGKPGVGQRLAGWYRRNIWKFWSGIVGAAAGTAVGEMPNILSAAASGDAQNLPTLNTFLDTVVAPYVWPSTSGASLNCAGLNGVLQLGLNLSTGASAAQAKKPA